MKCTRCGERVSQYMQDQVADHFDHDFENPICWGCAVEVFTDHQQSVAGNGGIPQDEDVPAGMFVVEDADGERLNRKPDWTYSEGCGCRITFFGAADYHTSRMLPGETCEDHTGRYQVAERDCLIERAKAELANYLSRPM